MNSCKVYFFLLLFCFPLWASDTIISTLINYPDLFDFDKAQLHWNHIEENLIKTGQRSDVKVISLTEASRKFVGHGFEVLEKTEELYRFRMEAYKNLGQILPRFHLKFSPDFLGELGGGIFGSLIPANWYHWLEAKQFYSARKLLFLDMLLNQNSFVEMAYYNIHQKKMEFEIYDVFYNHLKFFSKRLLAGEIHKNVDDFDAKYFIGWSAKFGKDVYEFRRDVLDKIPEFSFLIGETENLGRIDIEKIDISIDINLQYLNEDKLLNEMIEKSLELKAIKHFKQAALYSLGASMTNFIYEDDVDFALFGLSFGGDNVAKIAIKKSHLREIDIHYAKEKAHLASIAAKISKVYNVLIDDYKDALHDLGHIKRSIQLGIKKYMNEGDLKINLHDSVDFLLENTLRINNIQHDFLVLNSLLNRYRVNPKIDQIMKYLPVRKELSRLKRWAIKKNIKKKKNKTHISKGQRKRTYLYNKFIKSIKNNK